MKNSIYYIILTISLFAFTNIKAQQSVVHYDMPVCGNQNWKSPNDTLLWHEPYWWDAANMRPDFCEEAVDLRLNVKDTCAGLHIGFTLFLDLDGNNIQETVLPSGHLGAGGLGWNNLRFNNLYTPNYSGGEARTFDERPVASDRKYGFAMEEIATDSGKIVCVRFNTEAAPDTFYPIQLPHGRHRIVWTVSDSCGFWEEYDYAFTVKDCEAPVVHCGPQFSQVLPNTQLIYLEAEKFLDTAVDNCSIEAGLKFAVRKCGDGPGFPVDDLGSPQTSVLFTCCEPGTQCVELWVRDASGNTDSCKTSVHIIDVLGNCDCFNNTYDVSGYLRTDYGAGIADATVFIDGNISYAPPFSYYDLSNVAGKYSVANNVPAYSNITIKPERKDNPLNGVTTYDLVLISKHILGTELLLTPYKMIAADANKSNSITSFDIVELRKLILGIYNELPSNDSWRFVVQSFVFPNDKNPFQTAFPELIALDTVYNDLLNKNFVGIKVGDVNDSAVPNAEALAPDRSALPVLFHVDDRALEAGEVFETHIEAAEPLEAYQFTLSLNGLKALQVIESENVTRDNFNLATGNALSLSIDGAQAFTLRFQAEKAGRLSEMLRISDDITRAEAYGRNGVRQPILHFIQANETKQSLQLYQNYPNPFSGKTNIAFYLPEASDIVFTVYDALGRVMYSQSGWYEVGMQAVVLDKTNFASHSGQGYYTLQAIREVVSRKMIW